jgi:hypothetical protein
MEKVLAKLHAMGAFCNAECQILYESDKNKIYCTCINGNWECDMSQMGWGSYAYCPLYGFHFDLKKEKEKFLSYLNYLKKYKILKSEIINQLLIIAGAQPTE